ncbi:dockerin type I repeat-containing protein [Ruminococcus albus]|uniref:dockerin type I repeat-containing protein n=1 Tax=Ruminococcus albus TaxID=1264 RepID=UPI0004659B3A|nr:dockerin type I repeat-containing protein [Ruminococcus albus]
MYKNKRSIISRLSAMTTGILLAAQCFTAFAETPSICGDVNRDGKINVTDIIITAAHVKGKKLLSEKQAFIADVNSDGKVNISDITLIAAQCKGKKMLPRVNKPEFRKLSSLTGETLRAASNGKLVTVNFTPQENDPSNGVYDVKVTDIETEKIERVLSFDHYVAVAGIKKDGTLIIVDEVSGNSANICFYHPDKDEPEVVETELFYPDVTYNEENDEVYLYDGRIYKLTAQGEMEDISPFSEDDDYYISCDLKNKMIGLRSDSKENPFLGDLSVISLQTGKTLWNTVQHSGSTTFSKGYTVVTDIIDKTDGIETSLRCYDTKTGEKLGIYKYDDYEPIMYSSEKSDKFIFDDHFCKVLVFDPSNGGMACIDTGLKNMTLCNAVFLDEDTAALVIAYMDGEKSKQDVFILDTSKLEYNKLPDGIDVETSDVFKPKTLGDELKEQRKTADRLEDEYGITILIGNEVLNVQNYGYSWSSTEENMDPHYPEILDSTLYELEQWLKVYPEGFFEKFKTEDNPEGYRLLLIDDFNENDGLVNQVAGRTFRASDDYIDIAVSQYCGNLDGVMDHETWHAVEDLVGLEDPFDEDEWEKLNPEGFEYFTGDYFAGDMPWDEEFEQYLTHWASRNHNYENGYFVRDYSVINPHEDRATIMEFVYPSFTKSGVYDMEEELPKYAHINAKLEYMAEWIRPYFGYVYWEEMIKNKYIPAPGEALG